ncbi:hypothetical protein [Streptomyces sp. JV185]
MTQGSFTAVTGPSGSGKSTSCSVRRDWRGRVRGCCSAAKRSSG